VSDEAAPGEPPEGGPAEAESRIPEPVERRRTRRRRVLKAVAISTGVVVLAAAGLAWAAYRKLDNNIQTDHATARILGTHESERPKKAAVAEKAVNILLIGSDDRSGANSKYGHDGGSQRSDTTILLHLAADRKSATAVSIPRDLMADIPACDKPNGGRTTAQHAQFNWAFSFGGAACTIRTVENMTGIRIDHHLIVDFTGFKNMVNAVGGVDVCLPTAVDDRDAKLHLPAGRQKLKGEDALAYVRARHGFGDGSDTQRIGRQQDFLASLVSKMKSSGVLLNPTKLYPLLNAATSSLTADSGLDSLNELYGLAHSLQEIPTQNVVFLTAPREPYVNDPNRDQLVQPDADRLFTALRNDQPVNVGQPSGTPSDAPSSSSSSGSASSSGSSTPGSDSSGSSSSGESKAPQDPSVGPGATESPSAPTPHFSGTTADRDICGGP
jgi:LCP family protein required for cell wall assembly